MQALPMIVMGLMAGETAYSLATMPHAPSASSQAQINLKEAQAAQAAAEAQAQALARRRGMADTMLTSPLGAGSGQTTRATLGA